MYANAMLLLLFVGLYLSTHLVRSGHRGCHPVWYVFNEKSLIIGFYISPQEKLGESVIKIRINYVKKHLFYDSLVIPSTSTLDTTTMMTGAGTTKTTQITMNSKIYLATGVIHF